MMAHNSLSRSFDRVPMWIVQALFGLILSGGITWCTWSSVSNWKHETRITVVEQKVDDVKQDISEIKEMQKETNKKLDRLIERRGR